MGKKLITERHVSELFQSGQREIVIADGEILAPLARDFATSNRMKIIYGNKAEAQVVSRTPGKAQPDIEAKIKAILDRDYSDLDEAVVKSLIQKIKAEMGR